jgi:hypothetical protein
MTYFTVFMLFLVNILLFGAAVFFCHTGNGAWGFFMGVGVFTFLLTLGYIGQQNKVEIPPKEK